MKKLWPILAVLAWPVIAAAASLSHGPVIGSIGPDHAKIWGRTDSIATVAVEYGPLGLPVSGATIPFVTSSTNDYTFVAHLTGLNVGAYEYRVVVDGVPGATQTFRTAPPPGDPGPVAIAIFCDGFRDKEFPGAAAAAALHPDLVLTCGDMDHRNTDSLEKSRAMHRAMFNDAPFGLDFRASPLGREIPMARVWSDHDYCKDNSTASCASRATALQAWGEYHAFPEDNGFPQGIWQRFVYGQVEVFMLDLRSNRLKVYCADPLLCRTIMGPEQEAWLFDRLLTSTARWKVLVGDVPFHSEYYKGGDTWQGYKRSRQRLIDHIQSNGITGVVLVSGDIHSGGAIDDGTYSVFPELSVPLANAGFANTGSDAEWGVGKWPQATPGFGWILATEMGLTLSTYGADGEFRLSYTVAAP